ncbi:MAG: tetratricopeptide repeat protein, partial [Coleofasciculaceae cyanobacterium]
MSRLYRILISLGLVAVFFMPVTTIPALAAVIPITQISAKDFLKLGVENTSRGEFEQAIINFSQAIKLDVKMAAAYSNRCLVYNQMEEYQRAIIDCTQAMQLNPDKIESYLNRGLAYYRQGNYQEAIAD